MTYRCQGLGLPSLCSWKIILRQASVLFIWPYLDLKPITEPGEMAQLLGCLELKHEVLSEIPSGASLHPHCRETETSGSLGLAGQ